MTRLSPAAALAWKIAMLEAFQSGSENLEMEHLLIGIFSLEKAISLEDFAHNARVAERVLQERDDLDFLIRDSLLDATALRRKIRGRVGQGTNSHKKEVIHRSPSCRRCFDRAAALAGDKVVTCIHLVMAILEEPGDELRQMMDTSSQKGSLTADGSVTLGMTQALKKLMDEQRDKERVASDILQSRHTLYGLHKASDQIAPLRREIYLKTIRLARLCLDLNDMPGLAGALCDIGEGTPGSAASVAGLAAQVGFMAREGIIPQAETRRQILVTLQQLEQAGGTA